MLSILNELIEQRIGVARRKGEFDHLPGAGAPLDLTEDPLVPEEVRVANRVLKNAGMVPAEVLELKTLSGLEKALAEVSSKPGVTDDERRGLRRKLLALSLTLQSRGLDLNGRAAGRYRAAILAKLEAPDGRV